MIKDRQSWQELREGAYLLRTKLIGDRAEELWPKYIQLTEAEAVFRALKSELAIRPIFHQLERRVKAHVLVAFLGYALWVTLKHLLRRQPIELSPFQGFGYTFHGAECGCASADDRWTRDPAGETHHSHT